MRRALFAVVIAASLWVGVRAAAPTAPELISIFPFGGQQGAEFTATVRGRALDRVSTVWFDCEHLSATVSGVENEKSPASGASRKKSSSGGPLQLLSLAVKAAPGAQAGIHYLRILTPGGLSNPLPIRIHSESAMMEGDSRHELPENSQPIPAYPVVVNGKLTDKGEVDYYIFEAQKGEKLRFDALTAGEGFDPYLTLYEPTGSWFRSDRLTELAFNDEPVSYPGFPLQAVLTYEFPRKGRYLVVLGGFLGAAGPDHVYQLSIRRASPDQAETDPMRAAHLPPPDVSWKERAWKRELNPDRLKGLWSRAVESLYGPQSPANKDGEASGGGSQTAIPDVPVLRIDNDPHGASSEPVPVTVPVLVEGTIENPADIDRVKFRVKGGDRVTVEVQTLQKTIPQFNPYLRIVSTGGDEAFTNVHSRVNTCGDTIIKQVEPKTTYSFSRDGEFILEIRDITHTYGDKTFAYRVLLRQQVPHMGEVHISEDQVNLVAGEVSKLSIDTDQEEGFDGYIALTVEGLPEGVRAVMGTELEAAVPPPFNPGKIERFRPESQRATLLFLSESSTPPTRTPVEARVMAQPSMKGKLGRPILVKKILFTVVQPSLVSEERMPRAPEAR
ncbi:MAG: hypothetical protein WD696_23045 [Bryobacteraceae bacterium]